MQRVCLCFTPLIFSAAPYAFTVFLFSRVRDCTIFTLHSLTDFYVERVTAHRIIRYDHSCFHNLWPNSKTKLKLKHLWEQGGVSGILRIGRIGSESYLSFPLTEQKGGSVIKSLIRASLYFLAGLLGIQQRRIYYYYYYYFKLVSKICVKVKRKVVQIPTLKVIFKQVSQNNCHVQKLTPLFTIIIIIIFVHYQ